MNASEILEEAAVINSVAISLSDEQREIIELLKAEITELDEQTTALLRSKEPSASDELAESAVYLDQLAKAFDLSGLNGLALCSRKISENFTAISKDKTIDIQTLETPLEQWGSLFLAYLEEVSKCDGGEKVHALRLVHFLSQETLPKGLDKEERSLLEEKFFQSDISRINDDQNILPEFLSPEMSSLEVDSGVHPDLLEGLLIELPNQATQFEESINEFIEHQDHAHLARAQRLAHTIKGAANVVSIPGLANLTHFCEGLLESFSKGNSAKHSDSIDEIYEALVRASDSLVASAEYLNHQGPPPDELEEVLQLLLDLLKGTHRRPGLITEAGETATQGAQSQAENTKTNHNYDPGRSVTPALKAAKQSPITGTEPTKQDGMGPIAAGGEGNSSHERYINLPEKTARELLRLSGELQITNNQLGAKTTNMAHALAVADRQHLEIKTMALELESLIQSQSSVRAASMKYNDDEIDPLEMERFSELHTFAHRLLELTTDSYEGIGGISENIKELLELGHQQRQLNTDNQAILLEMSLVPVSILSSRFSRCVRQTSRLTGKPATLQLDGENLMVDSGVLQRMADPLMHLIRNAIDHGLESDSMQREKNGKSSTGTIKISFRNKGDILEIRCSDDGRGLDYERIKATAVQRGLLDASTPVKDALLNQLLLMPGFSTRSSASQTSGRGIGLDSVAAEVRALKGSLHFESRFGTGTDFVITVPTSILTSHALLVETRGLHRSQTFAIASRAVKNIIYVSATDIFERGGTQYYKAHASDVRQDSTDKLSETGHHDIEVQSISEALGIAAPPDQNLRALLIIQRTDGSQIAIGVEKIIASQDMVIKPLNRYSYQPAGVIGATILGDGSVSPVIDLHEVPNVNASSEQRLGIQEDRARKILAQGIDFSTPLSALIVDDSLSARRSLSQFVADMGMEVYTAKDGFDAINVMADKKPSVMLVDLEMPRMNGLELCTHIRAREEYQDIPVIMITSRSTARHKQMAQDAGVTRYLTKPWSDDELLSCIQSQIA